MANVVTTSAPQALERAELTATNRPPWPVSVAQVEFSPWDFVIEGLEDLAPFASGGNFVLPTGSYAFASPISLGTAQIQISGGAEVYMKGFGLDKLITGAHPTATIDVSTASRLTVDTLAVTASAGACVRIDSAEVRAAQCQWTSTGSATCVVVNGGSQLRDIDSGYDAVAIGVQITGTGGVCELVGCRIDHGPSNGVAVAGPASIVRLASCRITGRQNVVCSFPTTLLVVDSFLSGTGGVPSVVLLDGDYVGLVNCEISSAPVAVTIQDGNQVEMVAGRLNNGGIELAGGTLSGLTVNGVTGAGMTTFFERTGGVISSAQFLGVHTDGSVTNGIDWPAASLPSRGLLIVGCSFGSSAANAFLNFSETDPGVNVKACSAAGTLLPETPIV